MADEVVDLPYRAEYAKSGRAACKGCKEKIDKGELRLAVMVQVSKQNWTKLKNSTKLNTKQLRFHEFLYDFGFL